MEDWFSDEQDDCIIQKKNAGDSIKTIHIQRCDEMVKKILPSISNMSKQRFYALVKLGSEGFKYYVKTPKQLRNLIGKIGQLIGHNANLNWIDASLLTSLEHVFEGRGDIKYIFDTWDISNVKSMDYCFNNCTLYSDITKWDTSNVTSMQYTFSNCSIKTDISRLNTSNVENMQSIFYKAKPDFKYPLNIDNWDFSKVTDMSYAFAETICRDFTLSQEFPNLQIAKGMFCNAYILTQINFKAWNCKKLNNTFEMFAFVKTDGNIDISSIDLSNVFNISGMYMYVDTPVYIDELNLTRVIDATYAFFNASVISESNEINMPSAKYLKNAFAYSDLSSKKITITINDNAYAYGDITMLGKCPYRPDWTVLTTSGRSFSPSFLLA